MKITPSYLVADLFKSSSDKPTQKFDRRHRDWFWFGAFLVAALILYGVNLGDVALRDWDEGIVASVAREIWRSPSEVNTWLYPKIDGNQPYWNKPPLIHGLIAYAYSWLGISEFSTRLLPAILSALSVPLLYGIGREIFINSQPAIFSTLVYLTLLPVARHGRLAMLDGAVICFLNLTIWCVLRSRYHLRALLGVGVGLGLIALSKGIMIAVLLGAIAIGFLAWDCPRVLKTIWFWQAIILGLIPALGWYGLQYLQYGEQFLGINLGEQTFSRIWSSVSGNQGPPWYYLLEIAKYTLPWLLFLPGGIYLAIQQRKSSWAKLVLVWSGVYLVAISLMATKLPWYIVPIYPAFSSLIGANLARIWQYQRKYPYFWGIILTSLGCLSWGISIYFAISGETSDFNLPLVCGLIALTLTIAGMLVFCHSRQFITTLVVGLYLSLLLFFSGQDWLWELAEAYPVKPVAAMIKQHTSPQQIIYTSYPYYRPSLNFYSDRIVIPVSESELVNYWQQESQVYLLIEPTLKQKFFGDNQQVLGQTNEWELITRIN